ncbi:hypothetical protein [Lichenifustis flavocetrariae]|uniref:DNA primase/polymerase bifunctional N-terminal domain-containing protein n=1 Tax=Lichenifustis flavocetrariae TaxID=2949735 RepID=A0AA41YTK3_9HYPH|nr:hypothetical protein [Lichenifustis flavocetrariae]MCW6506971.1 hypothetical protein [Lichenifustis flavocetrariae]
MSDHGHAPRPQIEKFNGLRPSAAAERLQKCKQWLTWTYVYRSEKDKWDKPPHSARTGTPVSGTDPDNWDTYAVAAATAARMGLAGIGFALSKDDGLTGIDLDDCRDPATGVVAPWAAEIIALGETYGEVSPSGCGIRLFAEGKVASALKFDPAGVEIYGTGRYLTVTGRHVTGTPDKIAPAPRTIDDLRRRVETMRSAVEAEKIKQAPSPKKAKRPGSDFFRNVNDAALANLPAWVPNLFPVVARFVSSSGIYRVSSNDLDRDLEEDLSITPGGIVDFGVADMGDPKQGKRTSIDLVIEHSDVPEEKTPLGAAHWLCAQLGVEPAEVGFGRNRGAPEIKVVNGAIREAVDAAEDALIALGGVFQRADQIVCLGEVPMLTAHRREVSARRILPLGEYALGERLAEAATFMTFDGRIEDFKVVDPPTKIVRTMMERAARCRLPQLRSVISAPTLRHDGSLLSQPGYDESTGLFFDPAGVAFPTIEQRPSRQAALVALDRIKLLYEGFPFVTEADRSVVLVAVVTACVRQALSTAPIFGASSPTPGTGKSKLTDTYSVVATGREAGVIAQAGNEEELEKRLGGMLLQGASFLAIDNCTAPIEGIFLAMLLTQTEVQVRPLGTSRAVAVPTNAFLAVTGNNLLVAADLTRRVLVSKLDARVERPELRKFDFDPVKRAKQERPELVAAALTILLAFNHAGRPAQADPLGSFETWSRSVRDALIWLGCADPVDTMEVVRAEDPRRRERAAVLANWRDIIGMDRITTAKLIERAAARGPSGFLHPECREALLSVAGQAGSIDTRRLGRWLGQSANAITDGVWLEQVGISQGSSAWRLCSTAPIPSSGGEKGGLGDLGGLFHSTYGKSQTDLQVL